jgi:glycosyltransferase involved in cell wall biosynthesis
MNVVIVYVTVGGFPFQIQAISEIFEHTTLIIARRKPPVADGAIPLSGYNLDVRALDEPHGSDFQRKLALLIWIPRNLLSLWFSIKRADTVHAIVPGDIGLLGLLVALAQRKPLFVRHCGTWGEPVTLVDKALFWLLERIAGGRNVVLATGGAVTPPSIKNRNIQWIFSTSLSEHEITNTPIALHWKYGEPLQLITVGRLSAGKNIASAIEALVEIEKIYPSVYLHIVGGGKDRFSLEKLADKSGVSHKVIFHGNVSHIEVLRALSRSHLFIFPTRVKEGFPKALLEAMACGLPVIATQVSVIPDLIHDCGILLSEPNAQSISAAVLSLINDEPRMQTLAMRARQDSPKYTIERWRDQIRSHLEFTWGPLK